jgi:hypothetical protein
MLAIYIDGDNMSPRMMPILLKRISQLGDICILKVYRDWSKEDSKKWIEYFNIYRFEAVQCFRQAKKQSTDVYMITDLCNDIYTNFTISHILLATTDSDFIHLCHLINKFGKKLILIGKDKNLANLCYQFWYYNDLLEESDVKSIDETLEVAPSVEKHENIQVVKNKSVTSKKAKESKKAKKSKNKKKEKIHKKEDIYFEYEENSSDENYFNQLQLYDKTSKLIMDNDSLIDYLKLGMNNNYLLYVSELKKNLKNIDPENQSKINWRKIENELKKFPNNFLVINKKSKILVLMIPDILNQNIEKDKIIEIVNLKYPDILQEISIDLLLKNIEF